MMTRLDDSKWEQRGFKTGVRAVGVAVSEELLQKVASRLWRPSTTHSRAPWAFRMQSRTSVSSPS